MRVVRYLRRRDTVECAEAARHVLGGIGPQTFHHNRHLRAASKRAPGRGQSGHKRRVTKLRSGGRVLLPIQGDFDGHQLRNLDGRGGTCHGPAHGACVDNHSVAVSA